MGDASGRYRLVFNGEIYNYIELREEMRAKGEVFVSESDSEVLLRAYMLWGEDALPRLRGAFALGFIFAGDDNLLIGARNGPPLAIGYGDGEMYLGSDAIALGPFTDTNEHCNFFLFYYPTDSVNESITCVRRDGVDTTTVRTGN